MTGAGDLEAAHETVEVEDRRLRRRARLPHRGHLLVCGLRRGVQLVAARGPAKSLGEQRDPGRDVVLGPVLEADHLEAGVLQRRDDAASLVAPLDDEVGLQGEHGLDVRGERVVGDVVADLLRRGEDRPQDPVADRDPRRVLHADEVLGALVHRDEDRRRRLRMVTIRRAGRSSVTTLPRWSLRLIGPVDSGATGARRGIGRVTDRRRATSGRAAGQQHRAGRDGAAEDGSAGQVAGPRGPAARHG